MSLFPPQVDERLVGAQRGVGAEGGGGGIVAEQQLVVAGAGEDFRRQRGAGYLVVEVGEHDEFGVGIVAAVGKNLRIFGKQQGVVAVLDDAFLFAQGDEAAVVMVDGMRIAHGIGGVDARIVGVDAQPGCTAAEARLWRAVPLHRGAGVVTAARAQEGVDFRRWAALRREFGVEVGAFHVAVVVDVVEVGVGHADFFALVDVGRAAQAVQHARQHGRRGMVVFAVITKAAEGARLVVVVPKKGVPGVSCRHAGLPIADEGFQSGEVEGLQRPFLLVFVVHFEVVEGEDAR